MPITIHHALEVGNNHLLDNDAEFTSGFSNGNLFYYDTNSYPSGPLSCQTVYQFMREHLSDHHDTDRWNAGFVVGWLAGLCENRPDFFFTSIILSEPHIVESSTVSLPQPVTFERGTEKCNRSLRQN